MNSARCKIQRTGLLTHVRGTEAVIGTALAKGVGKVHKDVELIEG